MECEIDGFHCESGLDVKRKPKLKNKELIKWSLLIGSVLLLVFIISAFIALLAMVSSLKHNQGIYFNHANSVK